MIQTSRIQKRMEVLAHDGSPIGTVECVEGKSVKLAGSPDAREHVIPLAWIERVDDAVHLNDRWAPVEEGIWSRTARERHISGLGLATGEPDLARQDS